ncbi:MAG TPA: GH25 family lysozyme [Candidatus Dormibacteraeota bacterium]|nr:GH25 family lysozyme [Candidatus Dormibacteraeota bacterium]
MKICSFSWTIILLMAVSLSPVQSQAARDLGEDVSHFQAETGISQTSWNQMFTSGQRFVFVKATEGLSVIDAAMPNNMNRATTAGLRAGVYHFGHPDVNPTTNNAVQEADFLLNVAGNFVGPGYLRPVLDLEAGSGLSTTALTDWVIAFANEVVRTRGTGAAPIIYCTQTYANNELDSRLANYDLWLRTITSLDPTTNEPPPQGFATANGVFNDWSFWQYSSTGSSGGISPLDVDVCHSEFKTLDSFLIPAVTNPVAPSIVTQPISRSIRVGSSAIFNVGVSVESSTPLSYRWRFNGTNITGATGNSYTQPNAQLTNSGNYTVVVTNAAGSVTSAVAVLTVLNPPPSVPGTVLYQENFDEYSAETDITAQGPANGFNVVFGAASGPVDFLAGFGFNYSTVSSPTTIPSAPHSTNSTTKGLKLTVNKDGTGAAAAVNLYPLSQSFSGTFALKFDLWINYPNTSSATEHALFGINHSGSITNRIGQGTSDGLFFAMDGDGGSSASTTIRDYAVFRGAGAGAIPFLITTNNTTFGPQPLLGNQFDNSDPGFVALFPSKALSFTTVAGTAGNGWISVEVLQATNVITWVMNDSIIAQYTNTSAYTSGDILLGYNDAFASIGGADNFAIFDNIRVETVPDLDANGLADAWELQYFGHTGVDPYTDADGDGVSNLQEFQAGTNPTNATSTFRIVSVTRTNNNVRLDWTTVGGHTYSVQFASNSVSGIFADLATVSVPGSNESTTNYVHNGAATGQAGFYRVRLAP